MKNAKTKWGYAQCNREDVKACCESSCLWSRVSGRFLNILEGPPILGGMTWIQGLAPQYNPICTMALPAPCRDVIRL